MKINQLFLLTILMLASSNLLAGDHNNQICLGGVLAQWVITLPNFSKVVAAATYPVAGYESDTTVYFSDSSMSAS